MIRCRLIAGHLSCLGSTQVGNVIAVTLEDAGRQTQHGHTVQLVGFSVDTSVKPTTHQVPVFTDTEYRQVKSSQVNDVDRRRLS